MDSSSLKELTMAISLITGGLAISGIIAALAFFGFTLRKILQLLPAILGIGLFVLAIPVTVSRLQQPVVYQSRANPEEVRLLRVENKRVDAERVTIKIVLDRPAQVYLKYKGPGRDFIIPVSSDAGSSRVEVHRFTVIKNTVAAGSAIVVVEGEDRDVLTIN